MTLFRKEAVSLWDSDADTEELDDLEEDMRLEVISLANNLIIEKNLDDFTALRLAKAMIEEREDTEERYG